MTEHNLRVKNPSLSLYAFHLRTDITTEVVADADQLWENLRHLSQWYAMPALQDFTDNMICYQQGKYEPEAEQGQLTDYFKLIQPNGGLSFSSKLDNELSLGASIYPLRLHDTYAVDMSFFFLNQTLNMKQLSHLNPQGCLRPSQIQASLGQTLLLYVEPIGDEISDEELANECLKGLLQDTLQATFVFNHKGVLFGSPIFEYEATLDLPYSEQITHILVWVGKDEQLSERIEQANMYLIHLFNCRHKMLFAYAQGSESNQAARQVYNAIERKMGILNELPERPGIRLKYLELLLNETSVQTFEYAHHLRNLGDQRTTLKTNMRNYKKWLGALDELRLKTDDLTFLKDFHDKTCQHHYEQLGIEEEYLKPAYQLFSQMTTTILGIVQIGEQKQQMLRDQKFQFLITFIGAAVGAGAISATVIDTPPHLIDWLSQFFEWAQIPLIDLPEWLTTVFPGLSNDILTVIFHLCLGGIASSVFTPLILLISRLFAEK
jgi:hypothetical protein